MAPPSPETIEKEILHSARQWGLDPDDDAREDSAFCREAIDAAVASTSPSADLEDDWQNVFDSLEGKTLSLDLDEAVRSVLQVLLRDAEDSFFVKVTDAIDMVSAPFYRATDKRTGRTIYRRRPAFQRFRIAHLHPFRRFRGQEMDAAAWYYHCWYEKKGSLEGSVFEAMVAQYLENHMACASCECHNSLRWNGGLQSLSSWANVVCIKCHATYEIKSVANLDKLEMLLQYNSIQCGAFKTFYKYHPSGCPCYLLLVARAPTSVTERSIPTHQVAIGEIANVLPRFTDKSFIRGTRGVRLTGQVQLNLETVNERWCSVPSYQGDYFAIAKDVYIDQYGPERWNRNADRVESSSFQQRSNH